MGTPGINRHCHGVDDKLTKPWIQHEEKQGQIEVSIWEQTLEKKSWTTWCLMVME